MKTEERKKHESTIPEWVKRATGTGELYPLYRRIHPVTGFIGTVTWYVLLALIVLVIGFCGMMVLTIFSALASAVLHVPDLEWAEFRLLLRFLMFSMPGIILLFWWTRRLLGIRWLRKTWRKTTGVHAPPVSHEEALGALQGLAPERFHVARDIATWLGYCDPQLRPRDLAKTEY